MKILKFAGIDASTLVVVLRTDPTNKLHYAFDRTVNKKIGPKLDNLQAPLHLGITLFSEFYTSAIISWVIPLLLQMYH